MDGTRESPFSHASGDGTGDLRSGDIDAGDGDVAGVGRLRHDPHSPLAITVVTRIACGAEQRLRDTILVIQPQGASAWGSAL